MNSEKRRKARRDRRERKRAEKRARRIKDCTFEAMTDMNALYRAQRDASRGVKWKASTQRYQARWLENIHRMKEALVNGEEVCMGFHEFDLVERGKARHISSVHFSERVPQKSLTQNVLIPAISPSLVAGNSANIKGRGIDYALKRIKADLTKHYRRYGIEGYILQIDYADYFASIRHDPVKDLISKHVDDPRVVTLAHHFVDVQGEIGLGLGSEPNQIEAVSLPNPIDHFIVECLGVEAYGRYMDDSYLIHRDKEHLHICLDLIRDRCAEIGIRLNEKKTHIVKLSRGFTFLKKRIYYGKSGKVVMRPCRDAITRARRIMKRHARLVKDGIMDYSDAYLSYQSRRGSLLNLDAHETLLSLDALFKELYRDIDKNDRLP